ncbi:MAG: FkbM family methyltransferase [Rhodospirillaceae bacterium]|nr:FkbM family methyltransferase [Rhodospirillaceae bacterium]
MKLDRFLLDHRLSPILVDVGASGAVHRSWRDLAPAATCLAFDPDPRDLSDRLGASYLRAIVEPSAVVAEKDMQTAQFQLTRHPHCSSTLHPDPAVLAEYAFSDLFDVVGTAEVPATTIDQALAKTGLSHIDWLKLDTQGTDLTLLQSLADDTLASLKIIEVEPGYRSFYAGEDRFDQAHRFLLDRGFLLAGLRNQTFVPVPPKTLADLETRSGIRGQAMLRRAGRMPTAAEATYIREAEAFAAVEGEDHVLIHMACALAIGQNALAVRIAELRSDREDASPAIAALVDLAVRRLRRMVQPGGPTLTDFVRHYTLPFLPSRVETALRGAYRAMRRSS